MKELGFAVNRPQDILRGVRQYPTLMTWELCPECGNEVLIHAYGRDKCPKCRKPILPCSMCSKCRVPCVYDSLQDELGGTR